MVLSSEIIKEALLVWRRNVTLGRHVLTEEKLMIMLAPIVKEFGAVLVGIELVTQPIKTNSTMNIGGKNLYLPLQVTDSSFFLKAGTELKYTKIGKILELHSFESTDVFHLVNGSVRDKTVLLELITQRN